LLLGLPIVAIAAVVLLFDPNSLKPRITAAAEQALGRDLVLRGPIHIALSLAPALDAEDIHLANPPGFSRPDFATLGHVRAELALWPLLRGRVEIARLVLVDPDVMLETDTQGQVNWRLGRPAVAAAGTPAAPSAAGTPEAARFGVHSLRIEGGRLAWLDARAGVSRMAEISRLDMIETTAPEPGLSATAAMTASGHAVTMTAELGTLSQLMAADESAPWPMQVVLRTEGTRLAASGKVAHPLQGRGYALTLEASAAELGTAASLFGMALPALKDVSATARVSDASGAPVLGQLAAHAGPSALMLGWRHLVLDRLEVSTPALDQPVHAELEGALESTPVRLTAELGTLQTMLNGGALPLSLTLSAASTTLSVQGSLAALQNLGGVTVAVSVRVPDLTELARIAGQALPPVRDLAFDAKLGQLEGTPGEGLAISDARLVLPQADAAGDLTVRFAPRLSVQGQLASQTVNLDALLQVLQQETAAVAGGAAPASAGPAGPAGPASPAGQATAVAALAGSLLDRFDADVKLGIGALRWRGLEAQAVSAHAVLAAGQLTLDPVAATLAAGRLDGRMGAASQAVGGALSLGVSASGVPLKPLMGLLDLPDDDSGVAEISADVTASGQTAKAILSSLSGRLGVAVTEGGLDNRLLGRLAEVLRVTRLPVDLLTGAPAGRTRFRCVVLRSDLNHGAGSVGPLVLDSARLLVQGAGTINLDESTIALRLRPMLRTGGPGIVVPVRVSGHLSQPNVATDAAGTSLEGFSVAGLLRNPLGTLGNTLTGERGGDACGPAIIAARGARPGGK
jgi:AsmA protein